MDWTPVVAAMAGGGIGVVAEVTGRLGARRQAREDREAQLREQGQRHHLEMQEAVQKELRTASRTAAHKIVITLLHNAFPLLETPGQVLANDELTARLLRIHHSLYLHEIAIVDPELRRRLILCREVLDLATTPAIDTGMTLREIGVTVRNNVRDWIGEYLRDQPLSDLGDDWLALEARLPAWELQWKTWIIDNGYTNRASW